VATHSKYIIIGAGLSGLTTAYKLQQQGENDFLILEGRSTVGGRVQTVNGVDFGATWFSNQHQHLNQLLQKLQVPRFEQYREGKSQLIYNSMAPPHYFENDDGGMPSFRIAQGSNALIAALTKELAGKLRLDTTVSDITEEGDILVLQTGVGSFTAGQVIVTIPPKLSTLLNYSPPLPATLLESMQKTHTWMSNAIKLGMTFSAPFWRENGLSGTVISQISPVIELYDHTSEDNSTFALMGFVNEGLRSESPAYRKERILSYLEGCFGPEVREYLSYEEKDWSKDEFTACPNLTSVYMSPQYGNPCFDAFYLQGKLLFSGTETSSVYGGYLEGAVYSGIKAAAKLLTTAKV